ncbi:MAG TPA: DUF4397 domain-containing protein [Syntrophomonadaceae bacterium]|nr:DUF4397 domain-containing protein [Syntrophomonadaceae bacterium]HPR93545.1 DUF4397 domain-containing protein [Syntrophomonadaceae bacterium]
MPTINSFIRFLHASPGTGAVDIFTDGNLVAKDLAYNQLSEYLVTGPEDMHIQLFFAGEDTDPLLDTKLNIPASEAITAAIIGTLPDISLQSIFLNVAPRDNDDALIRFANLSPAAHDLDLAIECGDTLFSNVGYTQVTEYEVIAPGCYTLQLRTAGGDDTVLAKDSIEIIPRYAYTVYAIGLAEEDLPLEIGFYSDLIPNISSQIKETVFRKGTSFLSQAPRINLVYK